MIKERANQVNDGQGATDGRRGKQNHTLYDRQREVAGVADVAGWAHLAEPNGATTALIPAGAL